MHNRKTKSWTILAGIAIATSFGTLSMAYAQDDTAAPPPPPPPPVASSNATPGANDTGGAQQGRAGRRGFGGRVTMGTVTEVSTNEFLVKPQNGTSLITVTTTPDTKYNVVTTAKVSDLKVGDKVMVMRQPSADGSTTSTTVTARAIMVGADMPNPFQRPAGAAAGGFGGPPPGGPGGQGGQGGFPRFNFAPPISGTIAKLSPLKVTGSDGKTYTVTTSDTTTVNLHQPGTSADLMIGKYVMVMRVQPTESSDTASTTPSTSVTAASVTIASSQAALGMGGRGFGGRGFGGRGFGGGGGAGAGGAQGASDAGGPGADGPGGDPGNGPPPGAGGPPPEGDGGPPPG